ncbi:MAG: nicotinate-nicotinamide nucleotide adenylyltransferase [Spirochaetota bacterium]
MNAAHAPVFFFGGTFDPPHAGHKAIVRRLLEDHDGARVVISPAPQAPLRSDARLFSYRERLSLLRSCFAQQLAEGRVILSLVERSLPKPNYTYDTLAALLRLCGKRPVVVIGADQAAQIGKWHRATELMRDYEFVVFARGKPAAPFDALLRHRLISDFDQPVSATAIRADLQRLPQADRLAAARALADQVE